MAQPLAKAYPRKRFFLEMFTRDIALEDCILDLIDNSIDSLIRRDDIDLLNSILSDTELPASTRPKSLPFVRVTFSHDSFSIEDNCGGISQKDAREDAFNFGHEAHYDSAHTGRRLGAYGIGMKRAIFKIGNQFSIKSRTVTDGFTMDVNVRDWAKKDEQHSDWSFPMKYIAGTDSKATAGTCISISDFSSDVAMAFSQQTLQAALYRQIARVYSLFLGRYVDVCINGVKVEPLPIPLGESDDIEPSVQRIDEEGVTVRLIANLATKGQKGRWEGETAGWYVLCNGRVVVAADKTELTGWGAGILPQFQPKFRGFVGVALFFSDDPLKLPWTTTKRSLNRDAVVFQRVRSKMAAVATPIIRLLEKLYSPEKDESLAERDFAGSMQQAALSKVAMRPSSTFAVKSNSKGVSPTTTQINFTARIADIDRVKRHLKSPQMSKASIGEYVFSYFMKSEGIK